MKSRERFLTALTLAASMALPVAAAAQTSEGAAPTPAPTPVAVEPAPATVESAAAPATSTPRKAAMLSIIPGLSQHKMGNHTKAFIMEGAVIGGIALVATSGSSGGGSGDGGGSYTPPSSSPGLPSRFAGNLSFAGGDGSGSGNGDGNGDGDEGSSTARVVGIGLIAGGVAWSVIDAYTSAGRQSTTGQNVAPEKESRVGMNVMPSLSGVWATLAVRF